MSFGGVGSSSSRLWMLASVLFVRAPHRHAGYLPIRLPVSLLDEGYGPGDDDMTGSSGVVLPFRPWA